MNIEKMIECSFFSKLEENEYVGVEIEMPLVNMSNKHDVDTAVVQNMFKKLRDLDFIPSNYDNDNNIISLKNVNNEDTISLEYSFNTIEFSLNKENNIYSLIEKFNKYYKFINNYLLKYNHKLYDSGINPFYKKIDKNCLNQDRYKAIEKLLLNNQENKLFAQFCAYCCSIQTHINVGKERLVDVFNLFTTISENKENMFANSFMEETKIKNSRKYLWKNSNFKPFNVGENKIFDSIESIKKDYLRRSLFFIERDGKYYFLKNKYSLQDYYNQKEILITDFDGVIKHTEPLKKDFDNFRSYKDVELTKYGTLEIRTDCTQNIENVFKVVAFNVGVNMRAKEIIEYINKNSKISDAELIEYAKKGLKMRNKNEEKILE